MNKTVKKLKERRQFTLISFCIVLILVAIVISTIYREFLTNFNKEKNQILLNDELHIFNQIIEQQIYDTIHISKICEEVLRENPYDYETLSTKLGTFTSNRPYYLQVRFIDSDKMEQVVYKRNQHENYIIETPEDKSNRYYLSYPFTNDHQIYLSKLDLNIEYNEIEIPYNPVLRSVKPVYIENTLIGYIVLNFEMNETINRMKNYSPGTKQSYLINSHGDWLVGPEGVNDWGFMFDDIDNFNISMTHPQFWASINENQENFFSNNGNIFTYTTVVPKLKTHTKQIEIIIEETWFYMIHTSLTSSIIKFNIILLIIVLILIITAFIIYKIISVREKEKREAYNTLIEEQKKFHIISNTVGAAIILINSQGETKYWNQAAIDTFGYTEEEVVGRNIHTLIASEHDALKAKKGLEKFRHSGRGPFVGNLRLVKAIRKDGSVFSAELSIKSTMVKNEYWAVGIINDVSEREEALLELRKLSQAVKISKDIIFITDTHGNIEYVNDAFETITGYNYNEAIGLTPKIIHSEANQGICFNELLKIANTEGSVREIVINKRKDNSLF